MTTGKKRKTKIDHLFKMTSHTQINPTVKKRSYIERNILEIELLFFW